MKNSDNEDIIIQIEETLHLFLWPNNITTFFPLSSHVLFTMCWPCVFIWWWCCNLLISNQDLWLVRDKNVSWSLLYRIEHVLSQSVYHANSKSCTIQSNITVYTFCFVYDTSIMILALPCNRGLMVPLCRTNACAYSTNRLTDTTKIAYANSIHLVLLVVTSL